MNLLLKQICQKKKSWVIEGLHAGVPPFPDGCGLLACHICDWIICDSAIGLIVHNFLGLELCFKLWVPTGCVQTAMFCLKYVYF